MPSQGKQLSQSSFKKDFPNKFIVIVKVNDGNIDVTAHKKLP